jgi:hypothetical protein
MKETFLREMREKVDYMILGQHFVKNGMQMVSRKGNPNYPLEYAEMVCQGLDSGLFDIVAHPDCFMEFRDTISDEDKAYIMDMSTNGWLELTDEEKDEFTSLLGRWWEETEGYIVPDYDEMVMILDRQCEQYFRYDVNENLYATACDIFKVGAFGGNDGEGIGEVVPLTDDEKSYVTDKLTNDWLEMDEEEKDNYISLMARLMEAERGYIVPDFEEIKLMLDRQSEQYFKNGANEGVYVTACDILGI